MASGPNPDANPYVDPQNAAFERAVARLLHGKELADLTIRDARAVIHKLSAPTPNHPNITTSTFRIPTTHGEIETFLYKPAKHTNGLGSNGNLIPFVAHIHGGGWFLGGAFAYDRFVFDLIERSGHKFAVAFPRYDLAPEEKFPVQQEQCLEVLQWLCQHGTSKGLHTERVAVIGDSAGGQLACAVSVMNHQRGLELPIIHQILLHPLVDSTAIGTRFSEYNLQNGPFLSSAFISGAFRDYFSNQDPRLASQRASITASPIQMTAEQAREFMPSTTIITSQVDWLVDQGQDFARLLQQAGVSCGVLQGVAILHDAEVFKIARDSPTVELLMMAIAEKLKQVLLKSDVPVSTKDAIEAGVHKKDAPAATAKRKRRS